MHLRYHNSFQSYKMIIAEANNLLENILLINGILQYLHFFKRQKISINIKKQKKYSLYFLKNI